MQFTEVLLSAMATGAVKASSTLLVINERTFMPGAVEVAEDSHWAGELVSSFFKDGWAEIANGQSHIFEATVKVSLFLATILVAFWAIPWINAIVNEGYSTKTIDELFYPLLIIFMLALNNGALLSSTCILFYNTANYIDSKILAETVNGIRIGEAIQKVNLDQAHYEILTQKIEQCQELSMNEKNQNGVDLRTGCINSAFKEVTETYANSVKNANQGEGEKVDNWFDAEKVTKFFNKALASLGKGILDSVNYHILLVVRMILMGFQMAFVFLIEIAAILNVYISPVFLALSLLPGQSKLMHAWFAGWVALGLMKVSYTIIIGIAATAAAKNFDSNLLWLPILQAILSPILASAIATGGGLALFNGLTSIGAGGMRLLMKGKA